MNNQSFLLLLWVHTYSTSPLPFFSLSFCYSRSYVLYNKSILSFLLTFEIIIILVSYCVQHNKSILLKRKEKPLKSKRVEVSTGWFEWLNGLPRIKEIKEDLYWFILLLRLHQSRADWVCGLFTTFNKHLKIYSVLRRPSFHYNKFTSSN